MEELKNELREIANKPATKLTKEDKAFLSNAASQAGVDATITNPNCGTCWHELALKIYDAIVEQAEQSGEQPQPEEAQEVEQEKQSEEMQEAEQKEQSGEQPQPEEAQEVEPRYVLKKGVDVIFGKVGRVGVRVNALTLTDELGDKLIAAGFPKKYFERCE